ncbi:MAG: NFACT RNA binding domain-containing protein [Chlamydiota bacterium]
MPKENSELKNEEHLRVQLTRQVHKRLARVEKRLELHRNELQESASYNEKEHIAQMLQANFSRLKRGMKEIELEDWDREGERVVIPLDPAIPPEKIVKMHFKLVRKLKRRLEVAATFIDQFEKEQALWLAVKEKIAEATGSEALNVLKEQFSLEAAPRGAPVKKENVGRQPYKEFSTVAGEKIYVGKKDRDNDHLTFSFARGNDLWFHAADCPGSHVVLRAPKDQEVSEESIQDAMTLALHFSKAKKVGCGDVTWTQCKHISKRKGDPPGRVNVSKHKNTFIKIDEKRLKRLLNLPTL